jgi:predicted Zn-dependent protease
LGNLDRATDREQLRIRASYEANLGHVEQAAKHYRVSLEAYPDDTDLRASFARLLMLNRRYQEAITEFNEVLRVDAKRARAWIGLATCNRELNRFSEALTAYAKAFALEPAWVARENLNHEYGFTLAMHGDIARAREVFALALTSIDLESRGLRSLALVDMYEGKYRDAETKLRRAIALTEKVPFGRARNHLYLAILFQGQGDEARQIVELDRAASALTTWTNTSIWLHARVGAAYARAGAVAKAARILRQLRTKLDPEDSESLADVQILEAEIAVAKRDYARAIEQLQSGPLAPAVPLRWAALARAYHKAGDLNRAVAAYERLIELRGASLGWEPQQDWIEAHAGVAEIYLHQGRAEEAMKRLRAVSELWKNADRELSLSRKLRSLENRGVGPPAHS